MEEVFRLHCVVGEGVNVLHDGGSDFICRTLERGVLEGPAPHVANSRSHPATIHARLVYVNGFQSGFENKLLGEGRGRNLGRSAVVNTDHVRLRDLVVIFPFTTPITHVIAGLCLFLSQHTCAVAVKAMCKG